MAPAVHLLAYPLCQFLQKPRVVDGVHGIQAQAVEAVFEQPHQGVIEEEIPHFTALEINAGAPGCVHVLLEEPLGVLAQVIAVGAEVVVDHIEDHGQTVAVGTVDQLLELLGSAVGSVGRIGQHAVIAPIAFAGKLRQRHQFNRGDA